MSGFLYLANVRYPYPAVCLPDLIGGDAASLHFNYVEISLCIDSNNSKRHLTGEATSTWMQTNLVLRSFGPTPGKARRAYLEFMTEDSEDELSIYRLTKHQDDVAVYDESKANEGQRGQTTAREPKHWSDRTKLSRQFIGK